MKEDEARSDHPWEEAVLWSRVVSEAQLRHHRRLPRVKCQHETHKRSRLMGEWLCSWHGCGRVDLIRESPLCI